jgi:hypothetical protein
MNRNLSLILILLLGLGLVFGAAGCSDDDDDNDPTTPVVEEDPWIGVWRSEGANVAPLVYADPVNVDIAEATFNADGTISLYQHNHVTDAWSTNPGTYTITESATGDIHSISISYTNPAFDQLGIIQVIDGTPDTMKLEVVISTYTTVPNPTGGFGADGVLGDLNIQTYVKQ